MNNNVDNRYGTAIFRLTAKALPIYLKSVFLEPIHIRRGLDLCLQASLP
jgi:hypothetical protein